MLSVLTISAHATPSVTPPHLIMMVIDDLGWSDVGYHNSDNLTPNIDQLAAAGVKLDKYYVQQVCSPTRSALMSARYPFRTGLQHAVTLRPASDGAIPKDTSTIAEVLKASGYSTHAIGKWHLGAARWSDTPLGRGFDSYAGYLQGGEDYYTHEVGGGYDLWRNKTVAWDAQGSHSTPFFMAEATRVIEAHDPTTPMFLYFAPQEVHAPLQETPATDPSQRVCTASPKAPSPIGAKVTAFRHTLCAMASNLDTSIGGIVRMLQVKGMWNQTLVWLTADNGGMTYGIAELGVPPIAVGASSNWPLRAGKATLFEGGVRVTSFVSGGFMPDTARGTTVSGLMQHVDVPMTFAKLAGATWRLGTPDGFDMWPTILGMVPSPRTEVPLNVDTCVGPTGGPPCAAHTKLNALIVKNWKLIEANQQPANCPNTTWCTGAGLYDGWWTNDAYTHQPYNATTEGALPDRSLPNGGLWLFDLDEDPNERFNLAAAQPAVVQALRARLAVLALPSNGYLDPVSNIPSPRGLPAANNGTWAPYLRDGEIDDPLPADYVARVAASLALSYWD